MRPVAWDVNLASARQVKEAAVVSTRALTLTVLLLGGAMACGGNVARSSDENPLEPKPTGSDPSPHIDSSGTITTESVSGVWIFYHHEQGYSSARLSGLATIVDDCLFIRDMLVLWNPADASAVNALISAVQAGERRHVVVGGGASEPGSAGYPSLERCAGATVLFAAPGPQIGPSE
jgi:hypothetical protein